MSPSSPLPLDLEGLATVSAAASARACSERSITAAACALLLLSRSHSAFAFERARGLNCLELCEGMFWLLPREKPRPKAVLDGPKVALSTSWLSASLREMPRPKAAPDGCARRLCSPGTLRVPRAAAAAAAAAAALLLACVPFCRARCSCPPVLTGLGRAAAKAAPLIRLANAFAFGAPQNGKRDSGMGPGWSLARKTSR